MDWERFFLAGITAGLMMIAIMFISVVVFIVAILPDYIGYPLMFVWWIGLFFYYYRRIDND